MRTISDEYDKRTLYEEQMKPLVDELLQTARKLNLPTVISTAVANHEDNTEYISNAVLAITELTLFENRIANILYLMNDFYADAPEDIRNMVRELTYYLQPSVPDIETRINVRLSDENLLEIYKAACHKIDLHFPKGVFPDVLNDD